MTDAKQSLRKKKNLSFNAVLATVVLATVVVVARREITRDEQNTWKSITYSHITLFIFDILARQYLELVYTKVRFSQSASLIFRLEG